MRRFDRESPKTLITDGPMRLIESGIQERTQTRYLGFDYDYDHELIRYV